MSLLILEIKEVGNFYGNLHIKEQDGNYFMKVFCEKTEKPWVEINFVLYNELLKLYLDNN